MALGCVITSYSIHYTKLYEVSVDTPKHVMEAGRAIKRAFEYQIENKGFSFVEVLSACPTNWGMNAMKANERVGAEMISYNFV